jgi:hypothetical protein
MTLLVDRILSDLSIDGRAEFYRFEGSIRFDRLQLRIDAIEGTLSVDEWSADTEDRLDATEWIGPIGMLRELPPSIRTFHDRLLAARPPGHLFEEFKSTVVPFATELCASLERRFDRALRDGHAQLEGRFHSLTAPFSRIEPTELRHWHFKDRHYQDHADFDAGNAGDDRLLSLSVVPSADRPSRPMTAMRTVNKRTSKSGDGRDRHDWTKIEPVIENQVKAVKRQFGKRATMAEVKRRTTAELHKLGFEVPTKTVFDKRIKNFFDKN